MKFNHLPESADVFVQVCPLRDDANVCTDVTFWRKNPKSSLVYIFVLGAGGDGGSSASMGGGGGGSGGQTSLLIPALLLPDMLYVSTFCNSNANGLTGVFTHAMGKNTLTTWRAACIAYANPGTSGAINVGGAGGTVAGASSIAQGFGGISILLAGQAGTNGASSGAGTANTYPTTGLVATGGAGGGAANAAGGNITASTPRPAILGGAATLDGGNGINTLFNALLPSGGAGGGGSNGGAGGRGGNGGFGCGGGGAGQNGAAGLGGPGLIVIAQW